MLAYTRRTNMPHRHLNDILKIIYDSRLSEGCERSSCEDLSKLAEAEAKVHNEPVSTCTSRGRRAGRNRRCCGAAIV